MDDGYVRGSSDSGQSWHKGKLVESAQEEFAVPRDVVTEDDGESGTAAENEASFAAFIADIEKREGHGDGQQTSFDDSVSEGNTYHTAKYLDDLAASNSGGH